MYMQECCKHLEKYNSLDNAMTYLKLNLFENIFLLINSTLDVKNK